MRAAVMLRIDPQVTPTMMHYAVISEGEINLLAPDLKPSIGRPMSRRSRPAEYVRR